MEIMLKIDYISRPRRATATIRCVVQSSENELGARNNVTLFFSYILRLSICWGCCGAINIVPYLIYFFFGDSIKLIAHVINDKRVDGINVFICSVRAPLYKAT